MKEGREKDLIIQMFPVQLRMENNQRQASVSVGQLLAPLSSEAAGAKAPQSVCPAPFLQQDTHTVNLDRTASEPGLFLILSLIYSHIPSASWAGSSVLQLDSKCSNCSEEAGSSAVIQSGLLGLAEERCQQAERRNTGTK